MLWFMPDSMGVSAIKFVQVYTVPAYRFIFVLLGYKSVDALCLDWTCSIRDILQKLLDQEAVFVISVWIYHTIVRNGY